MIDMIIAHEAELSVEACREAWPRITGSGRIAPDCEVVTMVGRPSWVTNAGKWEEEERTIAWRSPESVTVTEESLDSFSQYVLGAVIDATGESWLTSERDPILVPHWDEPVRERVILPVGAPVVTAKHKERVARLKVLGAEGIWWQGMSDENYVHAVASILRAQALSPR